MAVDAGGWGKDGLRVVEYEAYAMPPGPQNPYGNGFKVKETVLEDEEMAQRVSDPTKKIWVVKNPKSKNRLGADVGYKLMSSSTPTLLAHPTSLVGRKGVFASKNLWVTPYAPSEMWPAGDYTVMAEGGDGLPQWTAKNRNVKDADVVLWHAFG